MQEDHNCRVSMNEAGTRQRSSRSSPLNTLSSASLYPPSAPRGLPVLQFRRRRRATRMERDMGTAGEASGRLGSTDCGRARTRMERDMGTVGEALRRGNTHLGRARRPIAW